MMKMTVQYFQSSRYHQIAKFHRNWVKNMSLRVIWTKGTDSLDTLLRL